MKHKVDYFGYVYQWTNNANGMKYIGSHYGAIEDYYVGSGKDFMVAYASDPENFTMEVLEIIPTNDKKLVLTVEKKWLDTVHNIKDDPNYYNLNNDAAGGFGYITEDHVKQRAETLKKKHITHGLSPAEKSSYKTKIQTRLNRIATTGFTKKEREQHSKYGYKIQITFPNGDTKIYSSCAKAKKELGIEVQYGLWVCTTKSNFKGYHIVKLQDPETDCRRLNDK